MHKSYRPFFFISLLIFCGFRSYAQEPGMMVAMRFLFLDESMSSYSVQIDGEFKKVSSHPYAISPPILALPKSRIDVFKEFPAPENAANGSPPQEFVQIKIATVQVPEQSSGMLAVLRSTEGIANKSTRSFTVDYYDGDPKNFPVGSVRLLNLGAAPIAVAMGEKRTLVEANSSKVIHPTPDNKNRLITIVAEKERDGGWNRIYNGVAGLRKNERMTAVIVFSPSGMRHTYTQMELNQMGDLPPRHEWLQYKETL